VPELATLSVYVALLKSLAKAIVTSPVASEITPTCALLKSASKEKRTSSGGSGASTGAAGGES